MSFAKYAALVKNLRGVVLLNPHEEGALESFEWLVKRFKYRNLGVTPSLVSSAGSLLARYLGGKPLRELTLPVPALSPLPRELASAMSLPLEVAETLVYASSYVSPALLVGSSYLDHLTRVAAGVVRACKEMGLQSWKLHLRIADYTALDFYEKCVDEALSAIEGADPQPILEARARRVEKDAKRYWRIMCDSGEVFLVYVDNLSLAAQAGIVRRVERDAAAALSIVPVVYVPPSAGGKPSGFSSSAAARKRK
uniref:Uncharacterized protein n=1 Tax=Thermofilum pendens TaxID=2269 RepID=A0A7J3X842_THEPE